jgi:hypothetical protein
MELGVNTAIRGSERLGYKNEKNKIEDERKMSYADLDGKSIIYTHDCPQELLVEFQQKLTQTLFFKRLVTNYEIDDCLVKMTIDVKPVDKKINRLRRLIAGGVIKNNMCILCHQKFTVNDFCREHRRINFTTSHLLLQRKAHSNSIKDDCREELEDLQTFLKGSIGESVQIDIENGMTVTLTLQHISRY